MRTHLGLAVSASLLAVGCAAPDSSTPAGPRAQAIAAAADAHGIAAPWLYALAFEQSRFDGAVPPAATDDAAPAPDDSVATDDLTADDESTGDPDDGTPADDASSPDGDDADLADGAGAFRLSDAAVARAATLTGADPAQIRTDFATNADAAAALLADGGQDLRAATARLLGVDADADATEAALADLDATLAAGFDVTTLDGERLVLAPEAAALPTDALPAPGHYPARQWIASPNFSSRLGYSIRYIVIHDIEGTMAGAISVFKHSSAQASAHYIVRARDGHVVQMVHEGDNAWHAGHAWFNRHSIGIEHEGFAHRKNGGGYYNETQYKASAALSCAIAKHYHIPIDRKHIFGHGNVPSNLSSHTLCSDASSVAGRCGGASHHSDPGEYWRWHHYMSLVRACVNAAN